MSGKLGKVIIIVLIGLIFFLIGKYIDDLFYSGQITKAVIEKSGILNGLTFDKAEQDSMIEGLNELLADYEQIQAVELDNSVVPALQFNPIPQGWSGKKLPKLFRISDYSKTRLPEDLDDLAFYSVGELAYLIKNKKMTSEEITEFSFSD